MKRSLFFAFAVSPLLAGFLFFANVSAGTDFNSSISNTTNTLSAAGVGQEDIDRILGEFSAVSETEILIDEELLQQRLAEIGIGEDKIREALNTLRASSFVELDESVSPEELEIRAPRVLPGSPFYGFKNAFRGVQSLFTFGAEKKAELSLRFANEKILEAEKLSGQGKTARLEAHLKSYEKDLERSEMFFDRYEDKKSELAQKFAEKSLKQQLKHQVLFGKFEKQAPVEALHIIQEIRDKVLAHTGETAGTIDDPEKIKEAISEAIGIEGSAFKPLRNLEVLKAIEQKVPEKAREAIHQAQENTLNRFKSQFEAMNDNERAALGDYIEHAGGNETLYVKVFDQVKFSGIAENANTDILAAKEKLFSRINGHAKEAAEKNPELAKQFFRHLEAGSLDDLRVISDIERTIDPALSSHISEVKAAATEKFQKRFEALDPQRQKEFAKETAQRFFDVKQIEIFDSIESALPEEKRAFNENLKQEVLNAIKERVEKTPDNQKRQMELRTVIGDSPEHIEILKGIRGVLNKKAGDELFAEQTKQLSERIKYIEDPGQLKIFEQKITDDPELRSTVERVRPEFFTTLKQKEQETHRDLKAEEAKQRIEEAERHLGELRQKAEHAFDALSPEEKERFLNKAQSVFENSRTHLTRAEEAFAKQEFGEAYGQATAAFHVLRSAEELIFSAARRAIVPPQPPAPSPIQRPAGEIEECKKFIEEWSSKIGGSDISKDILERYQKCKTVIAGRIFPTPTPSPEPVFCTQEYAPVCGVDGKTYSNRCVAEKQNGIKVSHDGECGTPQPPPSSSKCPEIKQPVCGADNRVYANECFAKEANVAVIHAGECKTSTACPFDRNPVCGANNTTYLNECFAKEAKTTIQYIGECRKEATPVLQDRFPLSGPIGTKVTVQGTGFTAAKNTIHFGGGIIPDITSEDGRTLVFTIPDDQVPACVYAQPRCLLPAPYDPVKPGNVYYISVSNEHGKSNPLPYTVTESKTSTAPPTSAVGGSTVTFSNDGFFPQSLTVKAGTQVTFVNKSSLSFWPASAAHPDHTVYPNSDIKKCGTTEAKDIFDACKQVAQGESWSFVFSISGSWKYHNHLNVSQGGAIVVE